ncbi:hypothetical protein MRX96_043465, partial [Rhipicephalus microplus]
QEVRLLGVLSKMDLNGIGYDPVRAHQTMMAVDDALDTLQREAWALAKRRVMITEPNLQGIFKSFTVCTDSPVSISVRAGFKPFPGAVLLTADYSQLELRLLAHLSQDEQLCGVFRAGGDVFRRMAALWSHCEEDVVDASLRQKTKQAR